ncbi:hypothetical protein L615_002200000190 [Nocardioides sp. J9]|uniref:hypothetical protein n=1 Tax=Nocardioides sp. J9 TaxID=935844 RepID=UPI00119F0DB5|nr:hypothetical protein [Nocardioides sp. J9]TWH00043.1 hypothetical protein L615_002200000190 [Nocardioides sp. J9]
MRATRWVVGLLAIAGVVAQLWVQVDWIGGLSEHCDYPEDCETRWLPDAFAAAQLVWLATAACGIATLLLALRLGEVRASLGAGAAATFLALVAYFFTDAWQWRGDVDSLVPVHGPRWDNGYRLALLLWTLSLALHAFALGQAAGRDHRAGRREAPAAVGSHRAR